jgi:molybdate transport system regulatory protein
VVGPGKIDLLRAVSEHGSISAAARAVGMGYKRAWSLLNELQQACTPTLLDTSAGGTGGGGAKVTEAGHALISYYDELDEACKRVSDPVLVRLGSILK